MEDGFSKVDVISGNIFRVQKTTFYPFHKMKMGYRNRQALREGGSAGTSYLGPGLGGP